MYNLKVKFPRNSYLLEKNKINLNLLWFEERTGVCKYFS